MTFLAVCRKTPASKINSLWKGTVGDAMCTEERKKGVREGFSPVKEVLPREVAMGTRKKLARSESRKWESRKGW